MNEFPHEHEALRIMRRRGMPLWARNIVATVSELHRLDMDMVIGRSRKRAHVKARNEVWYILRTGKSPVRHISPSYAQIGRWFGRDHSSIVFGCCHYALENGLPSPSGVDPEKLVLRKRHRAIEWWAQKNASRGKAGDTETVKSAERIAA